MWAFVSLSGSYETMIELQIRVDLPPGLTLTKEIPSSLRVLVRASGWSLVKTLVVERPTLVLRPVGRGVVPNGTFGLGKSALQERLRAVLPEADGITFFPDSIALAFGSIVNKSVPLRITATIVPRPGFKVIGTPSLDPDTITLVGAHSVIDSITSWSIAPVSIADAHSPVSAWANVSDSLPLLVTTIPRRVELRADVQEIGERTFEDIVLIDRVTLHDSTLWLVLRPDRVSVLLRGGVRDLSRLDPRSIRAYVELVEGVDTVGYLRPRLLLPQGVDLSVVRVVPDRIRYVFRRGY